MKKHSMPAIIASLKKNSLGVPLAEKKKPSADLRNAIYFEIVKSYTLAGQNNFTNDDEMKLMAEGLAVEVFEDFDLDLVDLLPDLFSIARKLKDIPTSKTIVAARKTEKWYHLRKAKKSIKAASQPVKNEVELLSESEKEDFFAKLRKQLGHTKGN